MFWLYVFYKTKFQLKKYYYFALILNGYVILTTLDPVLDVDVEEYRAGNNLVARIIAR